MTRCRGCRHAPSRRSAAVETAPGTLDSFHRSSYTRRRSLLSTATLVPSARSKRTDSDESIECAPSLVHARSALLEPGERGVLRPWRSQAAEGRWATPLYPLPRFRHPALGALRRVNHEPREQQQPRVAADYAGRPATEGRSYLTQPRNPADPGGRLTPSADSLSVSPGPTVARLVAQAPAIRWPRQVSRRSKTVIRR